MITPHESCRVASLNEESYLAFAKKHYSRKELGMTYDQWVRELVNLGVPLMTGIAIDMEIRHSLERARVPPAMAEHLGWCMHMAWEGNLNPGGWQSLDGSMGV